MCHDGLIQDLTVSRTVSPSLRVSGGAVRGADDPFNFGFRAKSAESRARGLKSEILNGRAAMMGIFGFISESKVPGSVPFLSGIKGFPHYDGDVMAPFSHDFSML